MEYTPIIVFGRGNVNKDYKRSFSGEKNRISLD